MYANVRRYRCDPTQMDDIMHLVDCIRDDKRPVPTGEHARHVVEVIEKAYLSAESGQAQTLETTVDG